MTKPVEKIIIGGKSYSRFINYPKVVRDGTMRCSVCGQIDEPEYHTLTCEEALQRARPMWLPDEEATTANAVGTEPKAECAKTRTPYNG